MDLSNLFAKSDPVVTIITIVLFIAGSVLSNYFKKRQQEREEKRAHDASGHSGSAPPMAPKEPLSESWEEKLRRMLDPEGLPPAQPSHFPPIIRPTPAPQTVSKPVPARSSASAPVNPTARPIRPIPVRSPISATILNRADQNYKYASNLQNQIRARFQKIDKDTTSRRVGMTFADVPISPNTLMAKKLTKNRAALRESFLASVLLARPRALEEL